MKRERGCRAKNSDIPSRNEEFAPEGFQRAIGKPFGGALGRAPSSKEPMIPPSCFMECSFRIRLIPPFLRGKDPILPVQRDGKAFGLDRPALFCSNGRRGSEKELKDAQSGEEPGSVRPNIIRIKGRASRNTVGAQRPISPANRCFIPLSALPKDAFFCIMDKTYRRECISLKRILGLLLLAALLCLGGGAAWGEELRFDSSREVDAYLDGIGRNYSRLESTESSDVFVVRYNPDTAEGLESIAVAAYVSEDCASITVGGLLHPDTSDMLAIYQTLERINSSVSFVRFAYSPDNSVIYCTSTVPYAADAGFGQMVERYIYITALAVDRNYSALAALQ